MGNTLCSCRKALKQAPTSPLSVRKFRLQLKDSVHAGYYIAAPSWDSRECDEFQGNFVVVTEKNCPLALVFQEHPCEKYGCHLRCLHPQKTGPPVVTYLRYGRLRPHVLAPACNTKPDLGLWYGWKLEEEDGSVLLWNLSDMSWMDYDPKRKNPFGSTKDKAKACRFLREWVELKSYPSTIVSPPSETELRKLRFKQELVKELKHTFGVVVKIVMETLVLGINADGSWVWKLGFKLQGKDVKTLLVTLGAGFRGVIRPAFFLTTNGVSNNVRRWTKTSPLPNCINSDEEDCCVIVANPC